MFTYLKIMNTKNIVKSIKYYPYNDSVKSLKFLPRVFSRLEKIVLLTLFGIIIISLGWIILRNWLSNTKIVPSHGGVLREGIVGEPKDIDRHISRLTNAGLTKYDKDKNIVADMAEKWEILDGGKMYKFLLKPDFSSQDLANQIISKNIWKDVEIGTPENNVITFTFKQPYSPFLYASTKPIFPYGPYKISKESKDEVELVPSGTYFEKRSYLDKVIIKLFDSEEDLINAANRSEVDSFGISRLIDPPRNFLKFEMALPRDLIMFFNLNNKDLQDKKVRQALKENSNPSKELNLRLVTYDTLKYREIAQQIADKWSQNGVKITIDVKDNITMQKDILPKRDYDLLLYGLDYGEDPDPYPFWHSSQVKEDGMNLSNFKNTKADKLLEQARLDFDFSKRQEKYAEFQKILDDETPMFVVEHQNYYYYSRESIYGIEYIVGSAESDRFENIAGWYKETKRVKKE